MRILLIHNKYQQPGGEDAVFHAEAELLERHGHSVQALVYDNTQIRTMLDKLLSGFKTIYNPASARSLRQKIRAFHPDIIHVHNFVPLASPAIFFVAKKHKIPVVATLHNYRLLCPSATLFHNNKIYEESIRSIFPWHAVIKGVYRNSVMQTTAVALMTTLHHLMGTWKRKIDVYIALTEFAKEKFTGSAIAIDENKIIVKPNFVKDYGAGNPRRKDFFLYVGRLTEEKGIRILLKAAALLKFPLVIIGEGPLGHVVKDAAQKNPNIHYLGFMKKEQVVTYMKSCRSLIFPSIWYEGFPVTIAEALCTGTPVIASALGCIREIITHRFNGLHFEAGSETALAAAITEITNDALLAQRLSENARLTYRKYYTVAQNYQQLMKIYQIAIGRTGATTDHSIISVKEPALA